MATSKLTKPQLISKIKEFKEYENKKESTLNINRKEILIDILEKLTGKPITEIEADVVTKPSINSNQTVQKSTRNTRSTKSIDTELEFDVEDPFSLEEDPYSDLYMKDESFDNW